MAADFLRDGAGSGSGWHMFPAKKSETSSVARACACAWMPTEASESDLVEASSSGLLFAYSGSPRLASALEWPSGNEGISRSSSYLTLADHMRNGTTQQTNARAIVPYVRPQAC